MQQQDDITVKLGDVAAELLRTQIGPRSAVYTTVVQLWHELLPDELSQHCKLIDISGGQVKVEVDSPCYMYRLRLQSSRFIEQLQQRCPWGRIKGLKLILA